MNNYLSLKLGGKVRGLKFGNRAVLDLVKKYQIGEGSNFTFSFELVVDMVFFALMNNCLVKRVDADFVEADVAEWVDDLPMDDLRLIFDKFTASFGGEAQTDAAPGGAKKLKGAK